MAEMSMVERVAVALADYHEDGLNYGSYVDAARAAIEAMREPSPAMQVAVSAQWGRKTWSQYNELIDAALKESE